MSYTKHTTKGPKASEADIILLFLNIHGTDTMSQLAQCLYRRRKIYTHFLI